MMEDYASLYADYNRKLKPLVAEIEGRTERFTDDLLSHLAKMFDEIALYAQDREESGNSNHLKIAQEALNRGISDSHQTLIMVLRKKLQAFSRQMGKDLNKLDGGRLVGPFKAGMKKIDTLINEQRYEEAYHICELLETECDKLVSDVVVHKAPNTHWITIGVRWMLSILISVAIGMAVAYFA